MDNIKLYFGVEYWKEGKHWFCDLTTEEFKNKKDVLFFIKDWYNNS